MDDKQAALNILKQLLHQGLFLDYQHQGKNYVLRFIGGLELTEEEMRSFKKILECVAEEIRVEAKENGKRFSHK